MAFPPASVKEELGGCNINIPDCLFLPMHALISMKNSAMVFIMDKCINT
jgi:hypothetical protein